jgi:hypothetical protein
MILEHQWQVMVLEERGEESLRFDHPQAARIVARCKFISDMSRDKRETS